MDSIFKGGVVAFYIKLRYEGVVVEVIIVEWNLIKVVDIFSCGIISNFMG